MRLIAGPRQVGKTTLAKSFLEEKNCEALYYNWDLRSVKNRFNSDPYFYHSDVLSKKTPKEVWICFDEIHKLPKWKNILKDAFDSFESKYRYIVTGSARLDLFKKSGDSLSGRFFLFRLLPISLFEMSGNALILPSKSAKEYIEMCFRDKFYQEEMLHLLQYSGFPEPLKKGDEVFSAKWHEEYMDTLIKEDLRDLTRIHELENIATLLHRLPERIGAPLSLNSLREDLSVSYNAVKNYIRALILTYVIFTVPPYSKRLSRTLKKESKVYFFDWSQVKDEAKRFENYIACELKHRIELWNIATKYRFELFYIRTRDGRETDFLIIREGEPYLLMEVKLSSETVEVQNLHHREQLNIPLVQIVQKNTVLKAGKGDTYVISASNFFG